MVRGCLVIQDFVWTVTTILMALAAGIFAWVVTAADKAPEEYAFPVAAFYRLRPWLFATRSSCLQKSEQTGT